jgi:hypothetical protein
MQPVPVVLNGLSGIMKAISKGRLFKGINEKTVPIAIPATEPAKCPCSDL